MLRRVLVLTFRGLFALHATPMRDRFKKKQDWPQGRGGVQVLTGLKMEGWDVRVNTGRFGNIAFLPLVYSVFVIFLSWQKRVHLATFGPVAVLKNYRK